MVLIFLLFVYTSTSIISKTMFCWLDHSASQPFMFLPHFIPCTISTMHKPRKHARDIVGSQLHYHSIFVCIIALRKYSCLHYTPTCVAARIVCQRFINGDHMDARGLGINVGDTTTVTCHTNYEMCGGGNARTLVCQRDGQWSGRPQCRRMKYVVMCTCL